MNTINKIYIFIITILYMLYFSVYSQSVSPNSRPLVLSYFVNGGMFPMRESLEWNGDSGTYKYFFKNSNVEKKLGRDQKKAIQSLYKKLIDKGLGDINLVEDSKNLKLSETIADKSYKSITFTYIDKTKSFEESNLSNLTEKDQKILKESFQLISDYCSTLR